MKNIITASLVFVALSTGAFACPGHHHPCSPTECAPAKESSAPAADDKKVAQVDTAKAAPADAAVASKTTPAPVDQK